MSCAQCVDFCAGKQLTPPSCNISDVGGKKLQRKSFHIQCGHQSSRSAGTVVKCYNMLKLLKSGRRMRRNGQKRGASGKQMPAQISRDISTLQISSTVLLQWLKNRDVTWYKSEVAHLTMVFSDLLSQNKRTLFTSLQSSLPVLPFNPFSSPISQLSVNLQC